MEIWVVLKFLLLLWNGRTGLKQKRTTLQSCLKETFVDGVEKVDKMEDDLNC
jgi:hypothetical protein